MKPENWALVKKSRGVCLGGGIQGRGRARAGMAGEKQVQASAEGKFRNPQLPSPGGAISESS
jgi:hypothetical protein